MKFAEAVEPIGVVALKQEYIGRQACWSRGDAPRYGGLVTWATLSDALTARGESRA